MRKKCKFRKICPGYRKDHKVCNDIGYRFKPDGRPYCGTYRKFEENDNIERVLMK